MFQDPPAPADRIRTDPDAHGQVALLLVESLLHGLLARGVLSADDAIGIVTDAADVKEEIIERASESEATARHSLRLIARIAASLDVDRPLIAAASDGGKMPIPGPPA